jgi:hypothetical protein
MKDKTQKSSGGWRAVRAFGIVLVALGVVFAAYSAYTGLFAARIGRFVPQPGVVNSTGGGYGRFNYTGQAGFRTARLGSGLYGVVIGALLALLGMMTFKYAGLRMGMKGA